MWLSLVGGGVKQPLNFQPRNPWKLYLVNFNKSNKSHMNVEVLCTFPELWLMLKCKTLTAIIQTFINQGALYSNVHVKSYLILNM